MIMPTAKDAATSRFHTGITSITRTTATCTDGTKITTTNVNHRAT